MHLALWKELQKHPSIFVWGSFLLHLLIFQLSLQSTYSPPPGASVFEIAQLPREGNPKLTTKPLTGRALSIWGNKVGVSVGGYRIDPNGEVFKLSESPTTDLGMQGLGGGNAETQLRGSGLMSNLHSFIDQSMTYPKQFIENGIEGRMDCILYFNEKGEFEKDRSTFTTNSNYLKLWVKRHMTALFKNPVPYLIAKKPTRLRIVVEFELGSPIVMGHFSKSSSGKNEFNASPVTHKTSFLYFHRSGAKRYGIGLAGTGEERGGTVLPAVDFLGLYDRLERILGLSDDKKREMNLLQMMRDHPEYGR